MSNNYRKAAKQHWIERCIAVHNFHVEQLKLNHNHRVEDTASLLNRSLGSVSQDIMIASWLKSHEVKIKSFKQRNDALEWIMEKKKEMRTTNISEM